MAFLDHHASDPFRLLVESVVEYAIFMLDSAGCVASWNDAAARIFGYTEAEIIGEHFSCFFTQEDIASGKPESVLKHATFSSHVHEAQRVRKDGSLFWSVTTHSSI